MSESSIFIGKGEWEQRLLLKYANRHGLVAGATGTGKTVTLQILSEGFSNAGVPVFMADVKGDLSGMAVPGDPSHKLHDKLLARAEKIGFEDYQYDDFPVVFWDLFGRQGHPIRTTVSEMGPLLLSRMLDLNETQEGVLNIGFRVADEQNLLLLDLKDLRALMVWIAEHAAELTTTYGNVSKNSVGAIQRRLLVLENQGADNFFGEPALALADLMGTDRKGRGHINILAADELMQSPRLYATFLLWLMSELFEELPEVGDPDKPKIVFFFDEAHLLFNDAPKSLIRKVEQVARLIRSKGVGIYFVTQNPIDIPDTVLGQLGNRVQHALRAYTPRDQKAVRAAAETFRPNPAFKVVDAITQMGVGEALVSTLERKGIPSVVDQTLIRPPSSRLGPATKEERAKIMAYSPLKGKYDTAIDRVSAFETLKARAKEASRLEEAEQAEERRYAGKTPPRKTSRRRRASSKGSIAETLARTAIKAAGSREGLKILRGILGSWFRGR